MNVIRPTLLALLSGAMLVARVEASATDCESGHSLGYLANASEAIVFGTLSKVQDVGYELVDGTISKAAPELGTAYRGSVQRFRITVSQVIKGQPSGKIVAFISIPAITLGGCPEKRIGPGTTAVFFLARRSSEYWVLEGRDGVVPTSAEAVPAILGQFWGPVVVP